MSKSLEPGDLAIVTKSLDGHATGKIVECVQIDYIGHPQYGTIWLVKSTGSDLVTEYGGVSNTAHIPQDWLKKIPKDPLPEEDTNLELSREDEFSV